MIVYLACLEVLPFDCNNSGNLFLFIFSLKRLPWYLLTLINWWNGNGEFVCHCSIIVVVLLTIIFCSCELSYVFKLIPVSSLKVSRLVEHTFVLYVISLCSDSSKEKYLASSCSSYLSQDSLHFPFNTRSSQNCRRIRGSQFIVRANSVSILIFSIIYFMMLRMVMILYFQNILICFSTFHYLTWYKSLSSPLLVILSGSLLYTGLLFCPWGVEKCQ